jgi:hypothetical protein
MAIRNFPAPKDAKGVVRFIGINFFHKFIPDLARRAAPLNDLRKKGVRFKWGQDQQAAFSDLKMCVMNPRFWLWPIFHGGSSFKLTLVPLH